MEAGLRNKNYQSKPWRLASQITSTKASFLTRSPPSSQDGVFHLVTLDGTLFWAYRAALSELFSNLRTDLLYLVVISGCKHIPGPVNDVLDTVLYTSTIVDEKDVKSKLTRNDRQPETGKGS